jgi:hypothetical protein
LTRFARVKTNGLAMHKRNVIQELSDVHTHRADIDIATKLIKRTKNIFETKLGLIFKIQKTKSLAFGKGILQVSYGMNRTREAMALVPLIPLPKSRL